MGYNIELTFNVSKNSSVTKIVEYVHNSAVECFCEDFYEDYEFENKTQFERRHCLITVTFSHSNIEYIIFFLSKIKKNNCLYIESIYDNINNIMLYASQYFVTQKMDKYIAKKYKTEKKQRSYSYDETMILNTVSK
jgi:hypothetical protein